MALTGTQMITEVCDNVGKALTALSASSTNLEDRVLRYLNWGQRRINRAYTFREKEILYESAATVDGVLTYPLITGTNNLGLTRPPAYSNNQGYR